MDTIYWTTANRTGDRFVVYFNGAIHANYVTFDECFRIVTELQK